jgi:hypothetical protein
VNGRPPVEDKLSKPFGHVIAFMIPGFVALWGLAYFSQRIALWLDAAATRDTSFLYAGAGALGLGLVVSGLRYFVYDRAILRIKRLGVPPVVSDDREAARLKAESQALYDDLRNQFYRYYQFYANSSVALAFSFVGWGVTGAVADFPWWAMALAFLLVETILFLSAVDAITKFRKKKASVLGSTPAPPRGGEGSQRDERRRDPGSQGYTSATQADAPGEAGAEADASTQTGTSAETYTAEEALTRQPES